MQILTLLVSLVGWFAFAKGYMYRMGPCPVVEPMFGFQMHRFLGKWYVMQRTLSGSPCISYNYSRGAEPGEYVIKQIFGQPLTDFELMKNEQRFTGELTIPDWSIPAQMDFRYPEYRNPSAIHVVFTTDYDNYAGIFTCQNFAMAHRESAAILSRSDYLDQEIIDQIREKLNRFGVNPFYLNNIIQRRCPRGSSTRDFDEEPSTSVSENLSKAVRKAGEKLSRGIQWVANAGSRLYHKFSNSNEKTDTGAGKTTRDASTNNRPNNHPNNHPNNYANNYQNTELDWMP